MWCKITPLTTFLKPSFQNLECNRDQHPLGILRNTIHGYFDTNYSNKFEKFDDLSPIVSVEQDKWMEVLGCGVTKQEILRRSGRTNNVAMVLFGMPDIRLFWSNDEQFVSQDFNISINQSSRVYNAELLVCSFSKGQLGIKFKAFSKYPHCYKDISLWINDSSTENNLCEVVGGIAGDLVEEVQLIDNFTNKKGMTGHYYRIAYRSMEWSLTDEEINQFQMNVRDQVESKLSVVLR